MCTHMHVCLQVCMYHACVCGFVCVCVCMCVCVCVYIVCVCVCVCGLSVYVCVHISDCMFLYIYSILCKSSTTQPVYSILRKSFYSFPIPPPIPNPQHTTPINKYFSRWISVIMCSVKFHCEQRMVILYHTAFPSPGYDKQWNQWYTYLMMILLLHKPLLKEQNNMWTNK